jgi:hypothetical protein
MMTSTGFGTPPPKFARRFRREFVAGYVGITTYVIYQKGPLEALAPLGGIDGFIS